MLLYQNSGIILDYDPATDILQVDYPDLSGARLPEVRHSLSVMVEAIRNFDVKRLLLDGSRTVIEVGERESGEIALRLATDLAGTRLRKVARIQTADQARETRSRERIESLKQARLLPYNLRTFTGRPEAMGWLKDGTG